MRCKSRQVKCKQSLPDTPEPAGEKQRQIPQISPREGHHVDKQCWLNVASFTWRESPGFKSADHR